MLGVWPVSKINVIVCDVGVRWCSSAKCHNVRTFFTFIVSVWLSVRPGVDQVIILLAGWWWRVCSSLNCSYLLFFQCLMPTWTRLCVISVSQTFLLLNCIKNTKTSKKTRLLYHFHCHIDSLSVFSFKEQVKLIEVTF